MTSSRPAGAPSTEGGPGVAATAGLYALARIGLVALVTALLLIAGVPLLIAVLVALIVALPLSMVLFRGMRRRLDAAFVQVRQRRSRERESLRAQLRGDADVPEDAGRAAGSDRSDDPAERESDPGHG
jgi:membrane protein implicated in regulation of membrane protease activity